MIFNGLLNKLNLSVEKSRSLLLVCYVPALQQAPSAVHLFLNTVAMNNFRAFSDGVEESGVEEWRSVIRKGV